jgi:hypothetical protein
LRLSSGRLATRLAKKAKVDNKPPADRASKRGISGPLR